MKIDTEEMLAILGTKIKAANDQIVLFPESRYLQGQKDALVNVIDAVNRIEADTAEKAAAVEGTGGFF